MSSSSTLIAKIARSRRNLLNILAARGVDVTDHVNFSNNEINILFSNNQLNMMLNYGEGDVVRKVFVKYHLDKGLRPANVFDDVEDLFNNESALTKADDLIIIVKDEPNDSLVNALKTLYDRDGYFVTVIPLDRLQYNVLEHSLVPKHRILSAEEQAIVFEKYNIMNLQQLPEISRFDPVAVAIGIRPMQVCHIERGSKTALTTDYYRVCVNSR